MLKLRFEVKNQFINRVDKIQPSADSQYYLYAHFNFLTEDWKGKVITAVFTKDEKSYMMLVDIDGDCEVPHEVIKEGNFYVSVFADTLITTNNSRVYVEPTGYVEDVENSEPPTPNIYNQLSTAFGELRDEVSQIRDKIDNIDGGLFTDWEEE